MKELIEKLTHTFGPSGYEKRIRDLIIEQIKDHVDDYYVDAMGNLITRKGTKQPGGKRVMISAHMDEIGLMVTHVDENGFASIAPIGGMRLYAVLTNRVIFENGVEGMIFSRDVNSGKTPSMDQLYVDTGARSREESKVKVGDTAVFVGNFVDMGDRWMSKTLDDRVGCLIAIETIKRIKNTPNELYFVFSVQEELGLRGAKTAAYGVDPEIGIAVDVTMCNDTPGLLDHAPRMDAGPCIKAKDSFLIGTPWLNNAIYDAAERAGIPYQVEVLRGSGTDAGAINLTRSGVPSSAVSVACRYVHSISEMVSVNDVTQSITLLTEFLSKEISPAR